MPVVRGGIVEILTRNRIVHTRINNGIVEHQPEFRSNQEVRIRDPHVSLNSHAMIVMRRYPIALEIKQATGWEIHGIDVGNRPSYGVYAIELGQDIGSGLCALKNEPNPEVDRHEC